MGGRWLKLVGCGECERLLKRVGLGAGERWLKCVGCGECERWLKLVGLGECERWLKLAWSFYPLTFTTGASPQTPRDFARESASPTQRAWTAVTEILHKYTRAQRA